MFAKARELAAALPEPSRTYMGYVNDRAVGKLGPVLAAHLEQLGADDPALSPQRVERPPSASLYLLHGHDDTVIPAAESAVLADDLRRKGANVRVLLSGLITHAEVNRAATALDAWKLVSFWAKVLEN
jgi:predicted peptidase